MENPLLILKNKEVTLPGGGDYSQKPAPVEVTMRPGQEAQEDKTNGSMNIGNGQMMDITDDCNPPHPDANTTTANYQEEEVIAPRTGNMAPSTVK